jgi:uncharacterized protein (DUF2249 family)
MVIRKSMPAEAILELDVREDLRNGREPFSRIMASCGALPAGAALRLRAIFEPVPLYAVMAKKGFTHHTEQHGSEDWSVWFYPSAAVDPAERGGAPAEAPVIAAGQAEDGSVVVLDVRGLEPPEPMVRTLAALEDLPHGCTLVQVNERVPQFLLPQLEERGFTYEIREQSAELVRLFITRTRSKA